MGAAAVKPSLAVSRALRERRIERKLTLRVVSDHLADKGERIPVSTLARIEQGKLDPGVRRLHMLLELYRVPPHLVADLVDLESIAEDPPTESDPEKLYRDGVEFWKNGDYSKGLACFFAIRKQLPADSESKLIRQRASLGFAIAAKSIGKHRLARQIVDDLLCEPPLDEIRVNVLVLAASLWEGLGSPDAALAMIRQAATHLAPGSSPEAAWVRHQEAAILSGTGAQTEAETTLEVALAHYRDNSDHHGEAKALNLHISILKMAGNPELALAKGLEALQFIERHKLDAIGLGARLEVGHLRVETGDAETGLQALREALSEAIRLGHREGEFLAHYYLWKAYEKRRDEERAKFELRAARHFVRLIDRRSPEADEVRGISSDDEAS